MEHFLAVHRIPAGTSEPDFRRMLQTLAEVAEEVGVDVTQTVYSLAGGQAFSIVEASSERSVRELAARAGLPTPDVMPASVVYTELLSEPRRAR